MLAYVVDEYPSYLDSYTAMNPPIPVNNIQLGGRLIPRSLVETQTAAFTSALRAIVEQGALVSGVAVNVSRNTGSSTANSVNPAWREAILDIVIVT